MGEIPEVRIVSDVGTLKALASVIRRRILAYLDEHGQATSTDLARSLGETTGTTSYHLRLLARHGLVREVESASRRERWWRKVPLDLRFPPVGEHMQGAEREAHLQVHRQRLAEDLEQLAHLLNAASANDMAWTRMSRSTVRVSREQLEELGAGFGALVARYASPAEDGPTDEATTLIQLRLYALPARRAQPGDGVR
jgi:DNA-binding transcriptional ArsR family regulator